MMPDQKIIDFLRDCGVRTLSPARLAVMERLYADLVRANEQTNLTRITAESDFWIRHVADSLAVGLVFPELLPSKARIADVGCGAGFPLLPLGWASESLQITGIESKHRKVEFVVQEIASLGLVNCRAVAGRAREAARHPEFAGQFDVVVARAVTTAGELLRECRGLLANQSGARLICYKTPDTLAIEAAEAQREAEKYHFQISESPVIELPDHGGSRQFLTFTR